MCECVPDRHDHNRTEQRFEQWNRLTRDTEITRNGYLDDTCEKPDTNERGDKCTENAEGEPPSNEKFRYESYDGSDGKVDKLTSSDNKMSA